MIFGYNKVQFAEAMAVMSVGDSKKDTRADVSMLKVKPETSQKSKHDLQQLIEWHGDGISQDVNQLGSNDIPSRKITRMPSESVWCRIVHIVHNERHS